MIIPKHEKTGGFTYVNVLLIELYRKNKLNKPDLFSVWLCKFCNNKVTIWSQYGEIFDSTY